MTATTLDAATAFVRAGYSVVRASTDGTKAPLGRWEHAQREPAHPMTVRTWFADGHPGVGLVCGAVSGNLEMLEFEGRAIAEELHEQVADVFRDNGLSELFVRICTGYRERTPSGGVHLLYRVDGPVPGSVKLAQRPSTDDELAAWKAKERTRAETIGDEGLRQQRLDRINRTSARDVPQVLIETRGERGFTIVAPSHGPVHPSGKPYVLEAGGVDTIPTLTADEHKLVHDLLSGVDQMTPVAGETPQTPAQPPSTTAFSEPDPFASYTAGDGLKPGEDYNARGSFDELLTRHGWTKDNTREDGTEEWRRPGKDEKEGISATVGYGGDKGRFLYVFSTSTSFEAGTPYSLFAAYTLLEHAGDYRAAARALRAAGYGGQTGTVCAVTVSEDHRGQLRMAERLVKRQQEGLRHVHGIGWHRWDGTRWARDTNGTAARAAVATIKAAYADLAGLSRDEQKDLLSDIRKCESATGLDGMLKLAGNLLPLAVSVDQLDADPYLFNTTSGTLDLHTGQIRPHDPGDLLTKVAGCGYDSSATSPTFDRFLSEVQPDPQVRAFLARVFGHALVGRVVEHYLPILTGTGANGKSTLIDAVASAFGDYAIAAEPDLLVDRGTAHPTGQADLLGVRLAVCSETDAGRRLAAATVKRLTGGDKVRARRMRQDFVEFDPSHSVVLVTNHKPTVAGDDPALWRRLRIVPFEVVVDKPDTGLGQRLALDLPAVLAWVVRGHDDWRANGMSEPTVVTAATAAYRSDSDALGRFLDEACLLSSAATVKARELFGAWSAWCHGNGEEAGTEKGLAEAMALRGYAKVKRNGTMTWLGLGLASTEDDQ